MTNSSLPPYIFQELPDITEFIYQPLKSTHRIKYTCFDVSKTLIAFGATSGGIYVFNKNPCEFVQLIPNKDGAITKVGISIDEKFISFANGKGLVMVTECAQSLSGGHSAVISKEHQGNEVTAMVWGQNKMLFCGDDIGKVSILQLQPFITKTMFTSSSQTIMSLDSRVCQLDVKSSMLLASTLTRCYICDTSLEQYRQIGQKLRDGEFGACFIDTEKIMENGAASSTEKDFTEVRKFNIVTDDVGFACGKELKNTVIYSARPGSRLWEVCVDGTVKRTHQFKQNLGQQPMNIVTLDSYKNENVCIKRLLKESDGQSINFCKLVNLNGIIFCFKKDALYFLNVDNVDNTVWFNAYKDIVDSKVYHNTVYVWFSDGSLKQLTFMRIDKFLVKCYAEEKYILCAELCALFNDYLLSSPDLSSKLHIVVKLREKLQNKELLDSIEGVLQKLDNLKTNEAEQKKKKGIFVVENAYNSRLDDDENGHTDGKSFTAITPETLQTLKDLSVSVTDKLNTSKKILKEKWEDFEGKMKQRSIEKQENSTPKRLSREESANTHVALVNNAKEEYENHNADSVNVTELDIVYRESSQNAIEIDNNSLEQDKICKLLYKYFRLSLVGKEFEGTNIVSLLDNYTNCDIEQIYNLMLVLEQYCISIGALEESKYTPNNIFLTYLNENPQKDDLLKLINENEKLCKFFVDSCISVNMKTQKLTNLGCECGYPLPFNKTNKTPAFANLIDNFIEKQWLNQSRIDCYEICKKMPYLWRKILYLRRNEDLFNILKILLQMLDETVLHTFLPQFTMETWDRAIQLYATLHANMCLNCGKKFENISVKDTLSWDDVGALIIKSVGGRNAIKIMEKHADLISIGELSMKFYHTSLLVAVFEKYDSSVTNKLADVLYAAYEYGEAQKEIIKFIRNTASGKIQHTALPLIVAANSTKWGLSFLPKPISNTQENSKKVRTESENVELDNIVEYISFAEVLENLYRVNNGITDCALCGLPLQNEVLIKDGGLWVFHCGHTFHGACLDLNQIKLCPSCLTKP